MITLIAKEHFVSLITLRLISSHLISSDCTVQSL